MGNRRHRLATGSLPKPIDGASPSQGRSSDVASHGMTIRRCFTRATARIRLLQSDVEAGVDLYR